MMIFDWRFANGDLLARLLGVLGNGLQIAILSALVLGMRCANYADVFVDGKIYFVDADCYSRMSRVGLVAENPGTVVRQHEFENYPAGIRPHTTAPLDYLIVGLGTALRPFTAQPLDLAGAIISPLLALLGGWFLWWWSRPVAAPGRLLLLLVYALSGILVHGTALGRPDQQSLLIITLLLALAAEWRLQVKATRGWSIVSGISWGLALWISLYEPLVLFGGLILFSIFKARTMFTVPTRRTGWWIFLAIILFAAAVERRLPGWPGAEPFFANWSATIGELRGLGLTNPSWLYWVGGLLLVSPVLLAIAIVRRAIAWPCMGLLALTFCLTIWQARWGYFFALVFLLTVPAQLCVVRPRWLAWPALALALCPFLFFWDARLWPNETMALREAEDRRTMIEWRATASSLAGKERAPVLTPWWLAPATAYWSGQPAVAGSSHESLPGIVATARFFLSTSFQEASEILREHGVKWVLIEDGEQVVENSAAILGQTAPEDALGWKLDHAPSQVPRFLVLARQTGACKIYKVGITR